MRFARLLQRLMTRKNCCALVGATDCGLVASKTSCHEPVSVGDDCNVPMPGQETRRLLVVFEMLAGPLVFSAAANHAVRRNTSARVTNGTERLGIKSRTGNIFSS